MPDQYVSKHVKIYDALDATAENTPEDNTEDLVDIRLEQQRACVSIIKHCQKIALDIEDRDKMREFVAAANHWIKKEKAIRRILVDLGQETEDEDEDDDDDEEEEDEDEEEEDDEDEDGDEDDDLPPPDRDPRTGKRLRH